MEKRYTIGISILILLTIFLWGCSTGQATFYKGFTSKDNSRCQMITEVCGYVTKADMGSLAKISASAEALPASGAVLSTGSKITCTAVLVDLNDAGKKGSTVCQEENYDTCIGVQHMEYTQYFGSIDNSCTNKKFENSNDITETCDYSIVPTGGKCADKCQQDPTGDRCTTTYDRFVTCCKIE